MEETPGTVDAVGIKLVKMVCWILYKYEGSWRQEVADGVDLLGRRRCRIRKIGLTLAGIQGSCPSSRQTPISVALPLLDVYGG